MKKEISEEMLLKIYETIKEKLEEIRPLLAEKPLYLISIVNKICEGIDKLEKLRVIPELTAEEQKDRFIEYFFSHTNHPLQQDFGRTKISITKNKRLKVEGRRGNPNKDFALDVLVYLLAKRYKNDFKKINEFLARNEIGEGFTLRALRARFKDIKLNKMIEIYGKFASHCIRVIDIVNSNEGPRITVAMSILSEVSVT